MAASVSVLVAQPLEDPLGRVALLGALDEILPQPLSISVNPSSFGRLISARRRHPGGTEKLSVFFTLSRENPKRRAAARSLIPSRQARRKFR